MSRETGIPDLGKAVIGRLFAARHESVLYRTMCRQSIRDARLWLDIFAAPHEQIPAAGLGVSSSDPKQHDKGTCWCNP